MANKRAGKVMGPLLALAALLTAGILGMSFYYSTASIHELLTENHQLNKAVRNLTEEAQIGYAMLQSQERDELGALVSVVRFVQTCVRQSQGSGIRAAVHGAWRHRPL
jgi:predicted Zn-dependent protease